MYDDKCMYIVQNLNKLQNTVYPQSRYVVVMRRKTKRFTRFFKSDICEQNK